MRILFVCGTVGHDPHQRTSRPTGGILNSLTLIPEYLASKGHDVYVQSTYEKTEDVNGVHYITQQTEIPRWDVCIFNRNVLPKEFILYNKQIGAKVVWWLHDIVQLSYLHDDAFKYVDHVVALSDYCRTTYVDFYNLKPDAVTVIPNGVDTKLFFKGPYEARNPNLWITASALIKGTAPLQACLQNLKVVNPDLDFRIYSSQRLHLLPNSAVHEAFLAQMEKEGAHVYHPVSPEVLSQLFRKAYCLLMPNSYPEICSNLLLQARASGLPVITSDIGSAPEFLTHRETGLMTTKYKPHDAYSWIIEYTNLALELNRDKALHRKISEAPASVLSWDQVGEKWNDLLNSFGCNVETSPVQQARLGIRIKGEFQLGNRLRGLAALIRRQEKTGQTFGFYWHVDDIFPAPLADILENKLDELPEDQCPLLLNWRLWVGPNEVAADFAKLHPASSQVPSIDLEYDRIPQEIKDDYIRIFEALRPVAKIRENADQILSTLIPQDRNVIGVHLRSDKWATNRGRRLPIEAYAKEIEKLPNLPIYLLADTEDAFKEAKAFYGDRIINNFQESFELKNREQRAFARLLVLAQLKHVVGYYLSTYIETAWWYGKCKPQVTLVRP